MSNVPLHSIPPPSDDVEIDYALFWNRLKGGVVQSLGIVCLFGVLGMGVAYFRSVSAPVATKLRVHFSFPGLEKGQNPDGTPFVVEDIRAPDVVAGAVRAARLEWNEEQQAQARAAIVITGVYPTEAAKQRADFIPNEYNVGLDPLRSGLRESHVREAFLSALVETYRARFQRTYAAMPFRLGTVFTTLEGADYFEYEFLLNEELRAVRRFLQERILLAPTFRSPHSGLSFPELLTQVDQFSAIKQDRVLGLIQSVGLSRDREVALIKMDYKLRLLADDEKLARDQEGLVRELLDRLDNRERSYVLASKSATEANRSPNPLVDHEMLDSLIKNDAYSFLIRKAMDAGQRTREIANHRGELDERRKRMESFSKQDFKVRDGLVAEVDKALDALKKDYNSVISVIRQTDEDFVRVNLADAVRVSYGPETESAVRSGMFVVSGCTVAGLLLAIGLSLIGFWERHSR